ncbi:MAG: TonB-dependent receptor, partial [Proteobacteria bacterium]|nr:TonB-dependent receptor [Pseudomonadota bacterium]
MTAKREHLIGQVASASQGTVLSDQLENRPVLRPGEVLEVVPGLVVTQHSGDGKANQYFLRGFNLDHGTDFATRVDGIPVNMPTHAHGQGYSDLNFLISELVERIEYKKGTYYAEEGNFSAAGAADIRYRRKLDQPLMAELSGGQDGFRRGLIAFSTPLAGGDLLMGGEYGNNDGPWDLKEGYRKASSLAKYSHGDLQNGYAITAMGYSGDWRSTDQIPLRAVQDGEISRFGAIDPTDGGMTHRYSVSLDAWRQVGQGQINANVYGMDYKLDLISNFTYALDQVHGDQFEQFDKRHVFGGNVAFVLPLSLLDRPGTFKSGVQVRYDDISPVALYHTQERIRYATVREDQVKQSSYSAYVSQDLHWTDWFRSELGLRADYFRFDVQSNLAANSGKSNDSIVSPKLALVFGPWAKTEYFLDIGSGFHSNDARGTTITVDPTDGVTPASSVTPLVRALGAEVGLRTALIPTVQLAASIWTLKLDSELLFIGDGGATEPSRATKRYGVELGAYYTPIEHLVADMDLAWSHARFTDFDPAGDRIPNAVETVASIGLTYNSPRGFYGGARMRYFGPGPLIEDNSVRSGSTTLVNLEGGYHFSPKLSLNMSVFNLFNRKDNDITYFYESQLPGQAAPVSDIHFHPVESRTVRVAAT